MSRCLLKVFRLLQLLVEKLTNQIPGALELLAVIRAVLVKKFKQQARDEQVILPG